MSWRVIVRPEVEEDVAKAAFWDERVLYARAELPDGAQRHCGILKSW